MEEHEVRRIVREEHSCLQGQAIGRLQANQERVLSELFGNGHEGLSKTIPVLIERVEGMSKTFEELRTVVSGLTIFEAEVKGAEEKTKKQESKFHNKWSRTWQAIAVIITVLVLASSIYFGFRNISNKFEKINNEIESQSLMMIEERGGFAPIGTVRGDTTKIMN